MYTQDRLEPGVIMVKMAYPYYFLDLPSRDSWLIGNYWYLVHTVIWIWGPVFKCFLSAIFRMDGPNSHPIRIHTLSFYEPCITHVPCCELKLGLFPRGRMANLVKACFSWQQYFCRKCVVYERGMWWEVLVTELWGKLAKACWTMPCTGKSVNVNMFFVYRILSWWNCCLIYVDYLSFSIN